MAIEEPDKTRPRRGASESVRRCVVTGQLRDKSCLVRFVVAPDGSVVADISGALPGRGVWVGAERALIGRACGKGGALARAGRAAPDLVDQVERLLVERCQSMLGLARRAGELAIGQDAVRTALRAGNTAVMIVARDASADGRDKIERLRTAVARDVSIVDVLDRTELGQAVGRASAVHLAVRTGRLAARLSMESDRLAGFRVAASTDASGPEIAGHEFIREAERQ